MLFDLFTEGEDGENKYNAYNLFLVFILLVLSEQTYTQILSLNNKRKLKNEKKVKAKTREKK